MKLQQTKSRYFLTIPIKLVKFLGWQKGQEIELVMGKNKEIILKEKA